MWSDEIDKKIKETAEGYNHPAYDEKAWDNMEVLLDKHLPAEKKRRRFIIFWLLPLALIGTGLVFILQKQSKKDITQEKISITPSASGATPVVDQADLKINPKEKEVVAKPSVNTSPVSTIVATEENKQGDNKLTRLVATEQIEKSSISKNYKSFRRSQQQSKQNQLLPGKKSSGLVKTNTPVTSNEPVGEKMTPPSVNIKTDTPTVINITTTATSVISDTSALSKDIAAKENKEADSIKSNEEIAKPKTQKPKSSIASKLSLNISGGPDISSVGIDNPGKWDFQYGVGLSYALSEKLSIRTGFFTGRKIYTADSADYHLSYPIPKLQKIDANCTVYEIPVNLIYNFPAVKKHNWFIAGGLSSYLMKKEAYDYYYKNAWGQMIVYSRTYKNENKHLFSVINLSGGYQYHFTERISLLAEPYARIPVGGVGHGKVKLNNAGILFTVSFKPFFKKD